MTTTVEITEGEAYAWALPVVDEVGDPLDISAGTPSASAEKVGGVGGQLVNASASLGDSYTIHGAFAAGALSVGGWRVQTWLVLGGEPQMLDQFEIRIQEANG
tara:strand:- start:172 stop:480 length:309 start_codon:yes stop_codon:yes gene_type:complete